MTWTWKSDVNIPARPDDPTIIWKGRQKSLRWSNYSASNQLRLELLDKATRLSTIESVQVAGWISAEDEIILRNIALGKVLVHLGLAISLAPLAGSNGFVVARLSATLMQSLRE